MGVVTIVDQANNLERTITCAQHELAGGVLPSGWVVTNNTCGQYFGVLRSPEASFGLTVDGASVPGGWYVYEAVIASDGVTVPTSTFTLPTNPNNVWVFVRRQRYRASVPGDVRDFEIDYSTNSITFNPSVGNLNGQTCYIETFR